MTDLETPTTSDPVIALRDELLRLRDRVKAAPEEAEAIDERHRAAEDKLSRTPAATLAGVAAKLSLYVGELLGRRWDGRIDRAAFAALDVDRRILVGALTDLERLGGAGGRSALGLPATEHAASSADAAGATPRLACLAAKRAGLIDFINGDPDVGWPDARLNELCEVLRWLEGEIAEVPVGSRADAGLKARMILHNIPASTLSATDLAALDTIAGAGAVIGATTAATIGRLTEAAVEAERRACDTGTAAAFDERKPLFGRMSASLVELGAALRALAVAPRPAAPASAEAGDDTAGPAPEAAEPHVFWLERHTAHANECADLNDAADRCAPQNEGLFMTASSLACELARRYAEMIYRERATTPEGKAAEDAMRAFYGDEWDTIPEETCPGIRLAAASAKAARAAEPTASGAATTD